MDQVQTGAKYNSHYMAKFGLEAGTLNSRLCQPADHPVHDKNEAEDDIIFSLYLVRLKCRDLVLLSNSTSLRFRSEESLCRQEQEKKIRDTRNEAKGTPPEYKALSPKT